jgi:hypothetical protein
MKVNSGLEPFGCDQRDHEIDTDRERDGEAKNRFQHDGLSDAGDEPRIKRENPEGGNAQEEMDNVGHVQTSVPIEAYLMRRWRISVRSGMRSRSIRISLGGLMALAGRRTASDGRSHRARLASNRADECDPG